MKMLYFYGAQFVLFIVTLVIYGTVYKNASRLIVNNMCYLLMVGFVILTRLDFDMAVRQFIIAVAAACISLVIPTFMLRVRMVDKWGISGSLWFHYDCFGICSWKKYVRSHKLDFYWWL